MDTKAKNELEEKFRAITEYVSIGGETSAGVLEAIVDGWFTAEQLRTIADYMDEIFKAEK